MDIRHMYDGVGAAYLQTGLRIFKLNAVTLASSDLQAHGATLGTRALRRHGDWERCGTVLILHNLSCIY